MEITITVTTLVIGLITMLGTTVIIFYVKDYLQQKLEYQQIRKKLEEISGRNAKILFCPSSDGFEKEKGDLA